MFAVLLFWQLRRWWQLLPGATCGCSRSGGRSEGRSGWRWELWLMEEGNSVVSAAPSLPASQSGSALRARLRDPRLSLGLS